MLRAPHISNCKELISPIRLIFDRQPKTSKILVEVHNNLLQNWIRISFGSSLCGKIVPGKCTQALAKIWNGKVIFLLMVDHFSTNNDTQGLYVIM